MKKKISLFILVIVMSFTAVLVAVPVLRYNVFRALTEVPGVVARFNIEYQIRKHRQFPQAAKYLDLLLSLSTYLSGLRSQVFLSVIDNAEYVVSEARLPEDFAAITPFLIRLVSVDPKLFQGQLWLARARLSNGNYSGALESANAASMLIPSDPRSYRVGISAAYRLSRQALVKNWCLKYKSASFGGTLDGHTRGIFYGTGLSRIGVTYKAANGDWAIAVNSGVLLGAMQSYRFDFSAVQTNDSWQVHLPFHEGITVRFGTVRFHTAQKTITISSADYDLFPSRGFMIGPQTLAIADGGGTIMLVPRKKLKTPVFGMEISLKFEKLDLASPTICEMQ